MTVKLRLGNKRISRRRQELLELLDRLNPTIAELTAAVEQEARKRPDVLRLMTHPGVGPLTALAFVLMIGTAERFRCGKQIRSYIGLIPSEDSSAGHQRLGHISKQGNTLLRFLLAEAAQAAARCLIKARTVTERPPLAEYYMTGDPKELIDIINKLPAERCCKDDPCLLFDSKSQNANRTAISSFEPARQGW